MQSSVNYRVENEYEDVANIYVNNYPTNIPRIENENFKDIKNIKMKVNFSIVFYSIIILINIFLLGYIGNSLIFQTNNGKGFFILLIA